MQHNSPAQSHPCDRKRQPADGGSHGKHTHSEPLVPTLRSRNRFISKHLINFVQAIVPLVMAAADRCLRTSSQRMMIALSTSTESSLSSTSGRTDAIPWKVDLARALHRGPNGRGPTLFLRFATMRLNIRSEQGQ